MQIIFIFYCLVLFLVCLIITFSTSLNISIQLALCSGQGSVPFQSNCCRLFFSFLWQQKPKCLLDVLEPPPHPPPLQRCFRWITMPLVAFSGVQLNVSRVMWLWKGLWLWTQLNILSWWRKKRNLDKHRAWWRTGQSAWVWPGRHRWSSLSPSLLHY